MNKILLIIVIFILAMGLPMFLNISEPFKRIRDGFSNYTLAGGMGDFPAAETDVLVQDFYPRINKNGISNNTSNDIWWHYPIFQLGSYKQITNNIRYSNNPDEGTCMPASMCGALYHEKQLKSNYIEPLPPVDYSRGTRVGYFNTTENLLPFRTNVANVQY
jgi:hypothetical protein